jgi:hypothetical protein
MTYGIQKDGWIDYQPKPGMTQAQLLQQQTNQMAQMAKSASARSQASKAANAKILNKYSKSLKGGSRRKTTRRKTSKRMKRR